jgi:uncharacterized membrane protein YoaK (UPF0700 family)
MNTISIIILLLLSLVGYSGGATGKAGKEVDLKPKIIDLVLVLTIWAAAIYSRFAHDFNKWLLIIIWVSVSVIVGIVVATIRQLKRINIPSEEETEKANSASFKGLWLKWKEFSRRMGSFQSRILLSLFFFLVVTPFALAIKLMGDPLRIKHSVERSFWLSKDEASKDLEEFRRQF